MVICKMSDIVPPWQRNHVDVVLLFSKKIDQISIVEITSRILIQVAINDERDTHLGFQTIAGPGGFALPQFDADARKLDPVQHLGKARAEDAGKMLQ